MDKQKLTSFVEKVFGDMSGAMTAGLCYVGIETGLFRTMSERGPMRLESIVNASGLQERYVEEWLKGMVCAGYLEYDADGETFELPEEHGYMLASEGTDHYAGGLFGMAPVLLGVAPRVAEAFRSGGGVPFEDYGEAGILALDMINRGNYEHRFASYWLQALPQVVARLESGARVLDVGCGAGQVPLALAKAFPNISVVGLDPDLESIRRAQAAAKSTGLEDRVSFLAQSTSNFDGEQGFDLITVCDCIHDFAQPAATLQEIRSLLKTDGTVFVVEPKVADRLEDNLNPIATMFYGFSVFHCMTQSLAQGGPGLGTCMGPARTESLMREAGFGEFRQLDIKSQVNLFYAARP